MSAYIFRRLLLMIPTLLGIMVINFVVVQFAPGGPVEQVIAQITGTAVDATARIAGTAGGGDGVGMSGAQPAAGAGASGDLGSKYRGAQGLDPAFVKKLEQQFGFDKPAHERFFMMLGNYLQLDFGESYFRGRKVIDLIVEKLPVSISLGLWTTLLTYLIAIPLGIAKAVRDGTPFDTWTSVALVISYSIPSFLFAVLLVVLFAGGSFFQWFPLRGLTSDNWAELSLLGKAADYAWHMVLPVISMVIGGFAGLAMLTKNSFLEEINKQYVQTARAKGLTPNRVLYGHVFRNAMLIVTAGFPAALIGILFTSSMLIEVIFSLDGLGLLGFEAALKRDYPIMFGTLFIFTLLGLIVGLISDLMYVAIDPRIDFESRKT
ncbi:microcin C ABC transporter permease YejB [Ferrovibrio sp.]|uniref:microcin C ABC transporter permease YejB n=1 Tax=Ferrovibrio sp. TaxID=1917215 RepID=UPI0025C6ACA1|nr:microcin C ABC transporter permease YejB [Ferrovibrio sp.]MBX3455972.1 microcin C ABC transporter permease YejB [Ferrovibrio sp.]